MNLHASDMQRLEREARMIESQRSLTYLADALRCLLDTGDPIAALALLRALWGTSHAKRDNQKAALGDAGRWLEDRIRRENGISPDRLALELGWLQRLVRVHGAPENDHDDGDRFRSHQADLGAPFGVHIELLRTRRHAALAAAARPIAPPAAPPPPRPDRLPDSFEARFATWQGALEAFKNARKRRKQGKPVRDRLLDVVPVAAELQPLATDLACSVLETAGMDQLIDHTGDLPSFWIAVADLAPREDKRVPSRISFAPLGGRAP